MSGAADSVVYAQPACRSFACLLAQQSRHAWVGHQARL